MNGTARQIQLHDGRMLGYAEYGDPRGRPLLYFHGFPSSRLEAAYCHAAARRLSVRIVAIDRPGYGLSDFQPQRCMGDWPEDVLQLINRLGIDRCSVMGVSGGGPYALACAWKLAERLAAVKIVGGLAPLNDPANLGHMSWNARWFFDLARRSEDLPWRLLGPTVGRIIQIFPKIAYALQRLNGSSSDRAILERNDIRSILQSSIREGLRRGPRGALWDAVLYAHDWGFPLDRIRVPVELWHGKTDRIVPPCHASMLSGEIPNSCLRWIDGEGHYSLPVALCETILT